MTRRVYLILRPETAVSVIQTGHMPDRLPEYITQREFVLYETPEKALEKSEVKGTNAFVVVLEIPDPGVDPAITFYETVNGFYVKTPQLKREWFKVILVNSRQAENLVSHLFNKDCPIPIRLSSKDFENNNARLTPIVQDTPTPQEIFSSQEEIHIRKQGDLLGSKMHALVNTVNCVGIMGKGIALNFKTRYPAMFKDYEARCKRNEVKLGEPYIYRVSNDRVIINFPTKQHWKNNSTIEDVERGLIFLAQHLQEWGVRSLAIPPLGCGNGGLNWEEVRPLIEQHLFGLNIPIEIYEPFEPYNRSAAGKREVAAPAPPPAKAFFEKRRKKVKVFSYSVDNIRSEIIARDEHNQRVGVLGFEKKDGVVWFSRIEVNKECRRQGIGQNLVRELVKQFPKVQFSRADSKEGYGVLEYRNNPGVQELVDYCFQQGILRPEINGVRPVPKMTANNLF